MRKSNWNGSKKEKDQKKGKRNITRSKKSIQLDSSFRGNFVNKAFSNFDLFDWVKKLDIKHFRDIYSRKDLPKKIKKECGIINLDDNQGPGTHWVCYRNIDSFVEFFDSFGLIIPHEVYQYLITSGKKLIYSQDEIQNRILFYVVFGVCII